MLTPITAAQMTDPLAPTSPSAANVPAHAHKRAKTSHLNRIFKDEETKETTFDKCDSRCLECPASDSPAPTSATVALSQE